MPTGVLIILNVNRLKNMFTVWVSDYIHDLLYVEDGDMTYPFTSLSV